MNRLITQHHRHVVFYILLIAALVGVWFYYPEALTAEFFDSVLDEVDERAKRLEYTLKGLTTTILTISGLIVAWKAIKK